MLRAKVLAVLALLAVPAAGAPPARLIHDAALRDRVHRQLAKQRRLARNRDKALFGVLGGTLGGEERDALEFLFAFMPLSDLADYDGEFYLRVVRATLEARRTMPWGPRIPEDVFLRYVLPHRVNTENLDDARPVLFAQLKDRVKDLALADAVLEVNHWCHERVTYRPSDMRTSAPLATIRTSWGRCGEESTLLVGALRAVGIPARQVYTPRWAHVDDNHAWVEAWVDGAWRFLGACEPAPALDMGWFREPARRAMMVHTKVMGGGPGPEEKVQSTPWFDEINVLSTYAPTLRRVVKVVDGASGEPVRGAAVEFGLYNSAEFYPLAIRKTGADGRASLVTGRGDLRIWVAADDLAGAGKLSAASAEVVVVLHPFDRAERIEDLDLIPPPAPPPEPVPVAEQVREKNERRLAEEDRLREAYMATFADEARSAALAKEIDVDAGALWPVLKKSQGNWQEIAAFLRQAPAARRPSALALLGAVSDKDLRDTPASVLSDHLARSAAAVESADPAERQLFVDAVLSPRIGRELLRPWRSFLQDALGPAFLAQVRKDPYQAVSWVSRRVRLDADANYYHAPLSPRGVYELLTADEASRDIFLVALLRSAGVPARLAPATERPQFRQAGAWKTVSWDGAAPLAAQTAKLSLYADLPTPPEYAVHFALARFEKTRYETLDFEGQPWSEFVKGVEVPAGDYVLTTGRRKDDGSVLCRQHYFSLQAGETKALPLELRAPADELSVLGRIDLSARLATPEGGEPLDLAKLAAGKGIVLAWLNPGEEPTTHTLQDLQRLKESYEKWAGALVLVLPRAPAGGAAGRLEPAILPRQARAAIDEGASALARALADLHRPATARLPVLLAVAPDGRVVFVSEGYSIGAGEQALETVRKLGE